MADIAGMQPRPPVGFGRVGDEDALRLRFVAPIAVHDEFAAHQYLAITGNASFGVTQRRTDGVHLEPRRPSVAADHRPRLGLAIALDLGQPDRVEANPVTIERTPLSH